MNIKKIGSQVSFMRVWFKIILNSSVISVGYKILNKDRLDANPMFKGDDFMICQSSSKFGVYW